MEDRPHQCGVWTDEEVELVARAEVAKEGARFINQAVLAHVRIGTLSRSATYERRTGTGRHCGTGRTGTGRLQEDQDFLKGQAGSPDPPVNEGDATPGGSASEPPEAEPDNACRAAISLWAGEQATSPGPQYAVLLKRLANRGEERIAAELHCILKDPHAAVPDPTEDAHPPQLHWRRGKSNTDTLQGSKRQLRRLHYTRMQALYARRHSEAAKTAIEGT